MYACPLCNGLTVYKEQCPSCLNEMEDQGRVVDYMDDYIAYLEYDGTNLIDGNPESARKHVCMHLFYCPNCSEELHVPVKEVPR